MNVFPVSTHALWMSALAVLIVWRIYRRVRRQIGRQDLKPRRLWLTAVFFPLVLVLATLPSLDDLRVVEAVVAGVVLGTMVGLVGLKLTRFEVTEKGHCYVPNTWIGVAISLLFIGRLVYRLVQIDLASGSVGPAAMQSFGRSPLTIGLFGVVAAYYATFALGVLVWHRRAGSGVPTGSGPLQNPTA